MLVNEDTQRTRDDGKQLIADLGMGRTSMETRHAPSARIIASLC
jgi:hypothetical protein